MIAGVILRRFAATAVACFAFTTTCALPAQADNKRDAQWYLKSLKVAEAQRITKGSGVTVAVIDSGVWAGHPDLNGAVLPGTNLLGDGGDGRQDLDGHGTAMAGVIAAQGRSGSRGLLGIAPAAKILPIRPIGGPLVVKQAIAWAVAHGAKVINMSFAVLESDGLAAAVKAAAGADVVLVAASGNDGEKGFEGEYPAAYPQVVAVGSVDRRGKLAASSHRGPQLDITAPGVDVPMLGGNSAEEYIIGSGTSAAAALVSGAAALVRAKYPDLSAAQVVDRLTSTAVDRGAPGRDDSYGFGELDIMAALNAKSTTKPSSAAPTAAATQPPVAQPDPDDGGSGIPPLLIIGVGVVLLVAAGVVLLVRVRRSRDA